MVPKTKAGIFTMKQCAMLFNSMRVCVCVETKKGEKEHFYFEHGMQLSEPKQYHHITVARKYSHISITENVQECTAIVIAITKHPLSPQPPSPSPFTTSQPIWMTWLWPQMKPLRANEKVFLLVPSLSAFLSHKSVFCHCRRCHRHRHRYHHRQPSTMTESEWLRLRWRRHDDLANIYEHFKWEKFVA